MYLFCFSFIQSIVFLLAVRSFNIQGKTSNMAFISSLFSLIIFFFLKTGYFVVFNRVLCAQTFFINIVICLLNMVHPSIYSFLAFIFVRHIIEQIHFTDIQITTKTTNSPANNRAAISSIRY